MGLFGWGKDKEKEKQEKADREHAETRRKMEESVQRRRAQAPSHPGVAPASTTAAVPGAAAPAGAGGEYTVQSGDSLSKIAQHKLGDASKWRQIYEANRATIGDNPDLIKPGQRLRIPG